jgi:integrase
MKLTALAVENWKPAAARQEVLLGDGLYLVVQPSGLKSWALRYRRKSDGKSIKHTLGSYPAISLKDARSAATELRAEIERGGDPHGTKIATRKQREAGTDTFEAAARRYVATYQFKRCKSWEWAARMLGLVVDPDEAREPKQCPPLVVIKDGSRDASGRRRLSLADRWGDRRLADITGSEIAAAIEGVGERAPILANRIHAVVAAFFKWAASQNVRLVATSPCIGLTRPTRETSRDRVLDDGELRKVWAASGELGHPYAGIVRLLVLTGQRRGEIGDLRWSEVDLENRLLRLPRERTKNGRAHDVPLSPAALAIIAGLPKLVEVERVFTIRRRPIASFSRMKEQLDARSGVTDWTLHDIRRTVASGLQRLGVRLEVTESVLNHASGSTGGIVGIYQRHDYATEKRDALQRWADHVDAVIAGEKVGKVVTLRG